MFKKNPEFKNFSLLTFFMKKKVITLKFRAYSRGKERKQQLILYPSFFYRLFFRIHTLKVSKKKITLYVQYNLKSRVFIFIFLLLKNTPIYIILKKKLFLNIYYNLVTLNPEPILTNFLFLKL